MRRAGAITVGKTNTPNSARDRRRSTRVFGRRRSKSLRPDEKLVVDLSGGAAVALACGLAPVVSGSIPAFLFTPQSRGILQCGGLPAFDRPRTESEGRVRGFTLSTSGCLGRSVADSGLRAEHESRGPISRAPLSIDEPGERFARPLDRSFKGCGGLVQKTWRRAFDPRVRKRRGGHRKTFESPGVHCRSRLSRLRSSRGRVAYCAPGIRDSYGSVYVQYPDGFKDTLKREIEEDCG